MALNKIPTKKRPKDERAWDPIHYWEGKDIPEEFHDAINEVTSWMKANEPKAYIRQIKISPSHGGLVIHAEGSNELVGPHGIIHNVLKKL